MGAADNLRTEAEAAEELGFSIHKMRKLRAAGEVAFIPGARSSSWTATSNC